MGLNLRFETDGSIVRARFTPKPQHIGFKGVVHGGILSTLLDEIMVWACVVRTGRFAYCGELNVRFVKPARPDREIVAAAELVANRRGRLFEARADLKNQEGELLAGATGKYLPINEADLGELALDFVDDPRKAIDGCRLVAPDA